MTPSGSPDQATASGHPSVRTSKRMTLRKAWSNVRSDWSLWLVAGTTFLSGALSIAQMLIARPQWYSGFFADLLPFGLIYWGRSLTLVFGFILVYLSLNLFQRRRVAWYLATGASAILAVAHIMSGHLAIAPTLALVLLLVFRRRFTVRSETPSIRRGIGLMSLSLLIVLIYGAIGFWLNRSSFNLHISSGDSVVRTLRQVTLVGNSDLAAHTRYARWFLESLSFLGLVAWVFSVWSLFRPVAFRLQVLPQEQAIARAVLERHGRSPYDFFKVWPDKSQFFSESKKSFIGYATIRGVAFVLGDPVGPDDELEKITTSFLDYCANNGWLVCFLLPDMIPMYERLGLSTLKIGEEAVVDLEHFSRQTAQKKDFRYQRRRFERDGYRFMRYKPPHSAALLDEVEEVSKEWLLLPNHREIGFIQGRFERSYVETTSISVVRDPSGRVIAFVNEMPSYRKDEAVLDMMRYRPKVVNAVMDYIFQETMLALKEEGYRSFNMGVAPFSGLGGRPGAPLIEKALGLLFRLNWFVSSQGLRHYKAKFEPVWEDRFVAYHGGPLALVRMGLGVTKAVEG